MPFAILGRNLEVMKLEDYVISADCARFLFKNMQKLRVLEIDYSINDELGYEFDADTFMRFLITGTFGSPEKLVLRGSQVWLDTDVLDCSLQGFIRLKHLEMDTVFLVNGIGALGPGFGEQDYETEVEESSDEDQSNEYEVNNEEDNEEEAVEQHDDDKDENETMHGEAASTHSAEGSLPVGAMSIFHENGDVEILRGGDFHPDDERERYKSGKDVWRLVSVLPESLETLVIHTPAAPRNSACVERMFWRFEDLHAEWLPNFERIEVRVYQRHHWGGMLDRCEDEVDRLREFFAVKKILTKFEVVD